MRRTAPSPLGGGFTARCEAAAMCPKDHAVKTGGVAGKMPQHFRVERSGARAGDSPRNHPHPHVSAAFPPCSNPLKAAIPCSLGRRSAPTPTPTREPTLRGSKMLVHALCPNWGEDRVVTGYTEAWGGSSESCSLLCRIEKK